MPTYDEQFRGCATAEEIRNLYRKLCKQVHPDLGPKEETETRTRLMQDLNAAYARWIAMAGQKEAFEKARRQGKQPPTAQDFSDRAKVDEAIRQAIEKIVILEGIEIEVCGLWVWVSGDTRPVKEQLKAAGYRFAGDKKKWYYAGVPAGGFRPMSMEEIRFRYGSQRIPTTPRRPRPDEDQSQTTYAHTGGVR